MKQVKMCVLLASILGAFFVCKTKNSDSIYNEVELTNIEALANSEDIGYSNMCIETGSTKCPTGEYVRTLFLKFDDETSLY